MKHNVDELTTAIVERAVKDWRILISKNITKTTRCGMKISFRELRQFFKSDWCRLLIETDPLIILEQLEKELRDAREKGEFF